MIWHLFLQFLLIGLCSIGGGYATIPLIQSQIVNDMGWLTLQEFTDMITISQMTPGPLAINVSTFVGMRIQGVMGAIVATVGCCITGVILSICLYRFFQSFQSSPYIQHLFKTLRAASTGFIAAAGGTILLLAFCGSESLYTIQSIEYVPMVIFCVCFFLLRKYRMNPIWVMGIAGGFGLLLYI